jgi:glycosyltransferase involved in cell wall biosynthesis
MSKDVPRVSIGLAVFNGGKYLTQAIDSILAQTYRDFELIISDNASTDRTEEICRAYAAKDMRIRYYRNDTNIGGANNENRTFLLSRGEYFRWAAHDDVCTPQLLAKCVAVLDREPSVVLCHTKVVLIDENGDSLGLIDRDKATSTRPYERFRDLTSWDHSCEELYGLIRSDVLRKTRLQPNYTDSDRTLLSELGLYGRFYQIPEPLFYRRIHPQMSTQVFPEWRGRMAWFFPDLNEDKILLPHWSQFFHYLQVITQAPIPFGERVRCYLHIGHWLAHRHGRSMAKDLLLALIKLLRSPLTMRQNSRQYAVK